jgi:arabinogalactan oligomer / maltooligosaccharide transport system substrate-binding protein
MAPCSQTATNAPALACTSRDDGCQTNPSALNHLWCWSQLRLPALATAALLAGCGVQRPTVTYVAVAVSSDEQIDSSLISAWQKRFDVLAKGFRQLNPGSTFQVSFYPEDRIVEEIRGRNRQGLGPDLLLVNSFTARRLQQEGLSDSFPAGASERNAYDSATLERVRDRTGDLVGLPMVIYPQLACFNRDKLPQAPATLTELLAAGSQGATVGLPIDLRNLLWTAGSLGAIQAFTDGQSQQPLSAVHREGLLRWFGWLQNASLQQRVVFYGAQPVALQQLVGGSLDWIPCHSPQLPLLRERMGARLGVAPLPNGKNGSASPVNVLRLWSLGRNSSAAGRARALAFSRYSLNPLNQRNLTLGSLTVLPANRFVQVPVQSSSVLAAMVTANLQGRQTNQLVARFQADDRRPEALQSLLNRVVFGEESPAMATNQAIAILEAKQ